MKTRRIAAIDVGTNTIRCIVAEAKENGDYRVLDDERAMVRLGEGLAQAGRISAAAFERAAAALSRMRKIVDGCGVAVVEAVATSAVRKAGNGPAFVDEMLRTTGISIRVISEEEEAHLAALSALHHFETPNGRYALFDIGGGSVEILKAAGDHVEDVCSLELGAVFLTERFLERDPIPKGDFSDLRDHVRKQLRKKAPQRDFVPHLLIGSGGTVTSIAAMVMALRDEKYSSTHRYEILRSEVVHLLAMLRHKSLKERKALAGLSPERADIIVAGVTVVDAVMEHLKVNVLTVNERGLREGLILATLRKHGMLDRPERPRDWRRAVEELARACHVDFPHAEHVRALSLQLFDALAKVHGLPARSRDMLEAAAVLHDIGYFIDYDKHHKHAYHLLRHADLLGFSPREKEVVANVARYHRRALPKQKHEGFRQLSGDDQTLVRRLGGLLRLADGLDRRRLGTVGQLYCALKGNTFEVGLAGEGDLSVELYGGREKSDLFELAFRHRLLLRDNRGEIAR